MKTATCLRLCVLTLLLCGTAAHARAQEWTPTMDVTLQGGNNRTLGVVDMMMPVAQNNANMAFVNLRTVLTDKDTWEGNAGMGLRHIIEGQDMIVGAYGYFDARRSEFDNTFYQITTGIEAIGNTWDARVNFYNPVGDDRHEAYTVAPNAALSGTTVIFDDGRRFEAAAGGFDIEAGHALPFIPRTYGYVARYDFNVDGGRDIEGYRTRLSSNVTDWLRLGAEYRFNDTVRDDGFAVSARLRMPLSALFGGGKSSTHDGIRARMTEPVVRDIDIITQQNAPQWQTAQRADGTGPAHVYFVDNRAAAGGDGSAQAPFATLAAAEAAAGNYDTIYVTAGDGTTAGMNAGMVINNTGQRLIGSGTALTLDTRSMNIPSNLAGLALREAATAPVITNAGGHGVTVTAANATVAGLRIDGAAGDGINIAATGAGASASNTVVDRVTTINNAGNGIFITAADHGSASAAISRSVMRDNTGHGVVIYDDTDGAFAADLGGGTLGSAGRNAIYDNTREDLAVEMDGATLAAQNNYWGQPGGPTATQIFAGAPMGNNPDGHWQFNETAGNATDRLGGHTGVLNNGATYNTTGGQLGGAVDLTLAGGQYVEVPDFAAAGAGDKLTVSYWVNPDSLPTTMTHIVKWDELNVGPDNSWGIRATNADGTELFIFIADAFDVGNNFFATSNADLTTGTWSMITMVYDGAGATYADRLKVYKNGVQLAGAFTGTIPTTLNDTAGTVTIGRRLSNDMAFAQYFDGRMDDVRIYDEALSPAAIAELYRMNGNSGVNSTGALAAVP